MSVALVVPVWNERDLLDSLCATIDRAKETCEVLVVDGGSTDGTCEALRERGIRVLEAPRGRANQMNAGAAATTASTLLFLHADTRLPDGASAAVADAIEAGATAGCFKLHIESPDPRLRAAAAIINLRSRYLRSATGDQALFVRRDVFEQIGGYREVPLCEDLDLVRRLRGLGPFTQVDAVVCTSARRWERGGVARTIGLMWTLRLAWHLGIAPSFLQHFYRSDVR
ncbi:MAG: TIGR04283 family arsenosugar biosynthesis glycosyltransferase [Polyangia bacterium]